MLIAQFRNEARKELRSQRHVDVRAQLALDLRALQGGDVDRCLRRCVHLCKDVVGGLLEMCGLFPAFQQVAHAQERHAHHGGGGGIAAHRMRVHDVLPRMAAAAETAIVALGLHQPL